MLLRRGVWHILISLCGEFSLESGYHQLILMLSSYRVLILVRSGLYNSLLRL